jgi:peptidoglycan/xylan/chitin deacetylase (PgdA/CDA1 family)
MRSTRSVALAFGAILALLSPATHAVDFRPLEIHSRLATAAADEMGAKRIALTLDACSGAFDEDLIQFLVRNRIYATLFVTRRWLLANPKGAAMLKAHLDVFDIEDHGADHIPAVIGRGRKVYGIPGEPDLLHLRDEVIQGAKAVQELTGVPPHWYRGATAEYDQQASDEIRKLGFGIAGFSINVDSGATAKRAQIDARLRQVKAGDVLIAHMNKPRSDTAEALSTGLLALLHRGFVFVRLDQVRLEDVK